MPTPLYIVNAFTTDTFGGNPAAVCPLNEWLADDVMQDIAAQHNLSETAFFVPSQTEGVDYHIRWFTPTKEVDLCGHATLASSFVIFQKLAFTKPEVVFECKVGKLVITTTDDGKIHMDFPAAPHEKQGVQATYRAVMGSSPVESFVSKQNQADLVLVYDTADQITNAVVNFQAMRTLSYRCIIATAASDDTATDFVCRVFAPRFGVDEDPVTGSAFTVLAPIWAEKLGKTTFSAKQVSQRGGDVWCCVQGERVTVSGFAKLYAEGQVFI